MQNCPHCSTSMENYATVCPGCGAEKRTELSFYFNWLGFLIGLPICFVLAVIIELIFDLSVFMAFVILIALIVMAFILSKDNSREHNTWHRK